MDTGASGIDTCGGYFSLAIDPNNPITPVCDFKASSCATPLRLGQGIPYSYTRLVGAEDNGVTQTSELILITNDNENTDVFFSIPLDIELEDIFLEYLDNTTVKEMNLEPLSDDLRLETYDKETIDATEIGYKGFI